MIETIRQRLSAFLIRERGAIGLLRLFALLSLTAVIMILALTAFGLRGAVRDEIVRQAEEDAVRVGRAIFEQERHLLVGTGADGGARMQIEPEAMERLNQRMLSYLPPLNMYKIKAFSADRIVIYSTDAEIIGRSEASNQRLTQVLAERIAISQAETKETIWHLAGEQVDDATVVETYLPVIDRGEVIGAFEVYVDITPAEHRIARLIVAAAGPLLISLLVVFGGLFLLMRKAVLQLKCAEDEMERLASTDPLTGIANRRYLLARANAEYASVSRNRERNAPQNEIGFIMADLDHFKRVNDTHGHQVGDEVLRAVAERIGRNLREYDVAGRFGGEEFLVMLPHTDRDGSSAVARRIHAAIRGRPIATTAGPLPITASIGVANTDGSAGSVGAAIKRADDSLYQAKRGGRDRVIVAGQTAPSTATKGGAEVPQRELENGDGAAQRGPLPSGALRPD